MSADDARPIIIKKVKKGGGHGHHGGAWKVAYADFVTAMMAFFLLMWLLNATSEKQRKGLADYFSPTIPVNRISGGGDGAFGGDSALSEDTLPKNGTGASAQHPTEARQARGEVGATTVGEGESEDQEVLESLEEMLLGRGGETQVMENELQHIVTRITDEGLVIEIFSRPDAPIFERDQVTPTPLLQSIAMLIAETAKTVENQVAVEGHVATQPIVLAANNVWEMSGMQATSMRMLLQDAGIAEARMARVTGHADREPVAADKMAVRNNRLEVILLRE